MLGNGFATFRTISCSSSRRHCRANFRAISRPCGRGVTCRETGSATATQPTGQKGLIGRATPVTLATTGGLSLSPTKQGRPNKDAKGVRAQQDQLSNATTAPNGEPTFACAVLIRVAVPVASVPRSFLITVCGAIGGPWSGRRLRLLGARHAPTQGLRSRALVSRLLPAQVPEGLGSLAIVVTA